MNHHTVYLFCLLPCQSCHSVSPSNITSQTNVNHDISVHLCRALSGKCCHSLWSSNFTSQPNIHQYTSVHLFSDFHPNLATLSHHPTSHYKPTFISTLLFTSSAHFHRNFATHCDHPTSHHHRTFISTLLFSGSVISIHILSLSLIIQHHITNQHSSAHFCSPVQWLPSKSCHSLWSSNITSQTNIHQYTYVHLFGGFHPNLVTQAHHPTAHHNPTLIITLLFFSFAHFSLNSVSRSHHPRWPHKPIFIITLRCFSFAQFYPNLATHFHHPTSHPKPTLIMTLLFTCFADFHRYGGSYSDRATAHEKGTFISRILCSSFAHFHGNVSARWHYCTSYCNRAGSRIVVFTCFCGLEVCISVYGCSWQLVVVWIIVIKTFIGSGWTIVAIVY